MNTGVGLHQFRSNKSIEIIDTPDQKVGDGRLDGLIDTNYDTSL